MLKVYNALSNRIEKFVPLKQKQVTMYVCGPTVYNYIHIGNARPLVFFDVVNRYFLLKGYEVNYISNFTDIDDKIIDKAVAAGVSEEQISSKYISAYNEDVKSLHCLDVNIRAKVTDYLDEIAAFIEQLVAQGDAYEVDGDVYFKVENFAKYGQLSNNKLADLNVGKRIDVNDLKISPYDFTLWKKTTTGITFDSAFGKGRPGWHTECVVMIKSLTDGMIDIHGGGKDLAFPHHENEIVQSMAYDQTNLANYWLHNGMVKLNDNKMSKSLGNVLLVRDLLQEYDANVIRLALLQSAYRDDMNFSDDLLNASIKINHKIYQAFKLLSLNVQVSKQSCKAASKAYFKYLEDDFNTPNLITYGLNLIKDINIAIKDGSLGLDYYNELIETIYLLGLEYNYVTLTNEDILLYQAWESARANKDYEQADEYRKQLVQRGII